MGDQDVAAAWPRPAGRGPVVALGKLVADQVLELCAPLVVGGQQRVVRTTTAGGAPANVTANLARLGVPARLAGWAGADPLTDGLLAALTGRGIETAVVRRGRAPLSTVLVHPDGERTLLSDRGEGGLETADIRPEWLAGAAVVHLDGYDLLPGRFPEALRAAVSLAHDAGVPVSVDVAAATRMRDHGADGYVELLAGLRPDVMFCNAVEAEVLGLTGGRPAWAPDLVLVHAGARPTRVLTRAGAWWTPSGPAMRRPRWSPAWSVPSRRPDHQAAIDSDPAERSRLVRGDHGKSTYHDVPTPTTGAPTAWPPPSRTPERPAGCVAGRPTRSRSRLTSRSAVPGSTVPRPLATTGTAPRRTTPVRRRWRNGRATRGPRQHLVALSSLSHRCDPARRPDRNAIAAAAVTAP